MERLRTPFFVVATLLIALVVCLETGSPYLQRLRFLERIFAASEVSLEQLLREQLADQDLDEDEMREILAEALANQEKPPGLGLPAMALLDGIVMFTVGLMGLALVVPERIHVKYQGVATLIFSITILLLAIVGIMLAMVLLFIMIALLLAFPFGTIFYLIKWGMFPKGQAMAMLGFISMLRLGFAVCLVLAHQRFIQNKGLVLMLLTAMLGGIIVTFLHGIMPSVLVSITDAVAAIVVCILAAIWAIILLIGSIVSIAKVAI